MKKWTALLAAISLIAACSAVYALSTGGPGGTWPKTWPKELESLRKQAWTWQHADSGDVSYDIPFATREEFEAAWPHILTLRGKGSPLTLVSGSRLRVGAGKTTAGVQIYPPAKWMKEGPRSLTQIVVVVDGQLVDLNRIPFPADAPIIDERFKDAGKAGEKKEAPKPVGEPESGAN